MVIPIPNGTAADSCICLKNVLFTPEVSYNLISVGRIDDAGFTATFTDGQCIIVGPEGSTVGRIPKTGGLYLVCRERVNGAEAPAAAAALKVEALTEIEAHRRFAHIPVRVVHELVARGFITGVKLVPSKEPLTCEVCIRTKTTRKPVPIKHEGEHAQALGEEIHSNTWGPTCVATLGGHKYYVSFTDDATQFSTVYLMRSKSNTFSSYISYEAWLETQEGIHIKAFNIDHGGKYLSDEFLAHLDSRGVALKLSVRDTHKHAGVSERLNCTVMEKVRMMLITLGLPRFLWGEALMHAVWLKNRTSTKALNGHTPYEALTGSPPDLSSIPVWGSQVWVHDELTGKVGVCALTMHWVSFDTQSKGHRVYWPEHHSVTIERNLHFASPNLLALFVDDDAELVEEGEAANDMLTSPEPTLTPELVSTTPAPTIVNAVPVLPITTRSSCVCMPSHKVCDILEGHSLDKKLL